MPSPKLALFALICVTSLVACEADPLTTNQAPTQFVDADTNEIANAIADDINSRAGENLGSGVAFREAIATGSDLQMELRLNTAASGINDSDRRRAASGIRNSLRRSLCSSSSLSALLAGGGTVTIAIYGRDNAIIDTFFYDRPCR